MKTFSGRIHECEVCHGRGVWQKGWRHAFMPSDIDGNFPTKWCSEKCEMQWYDEWEKGQRREVATAKR